MRQIHIIVLLLCGFYTLSAQRIVKVHGVYDYPVPRTQSLEEAEQTAIERARRQALIDEFNLTVGETGTVSIHNKSTDGTAQTQEQFNFYSTQEALAEWIDDTKEPKLEHIHDKNGIWVIHAEVWGKARKIEQADVELQIRVFNRGFETTNFKNKDRISIGFKSAADGYVAIFIREDDNEIVNLMMPYENGDGSAVAVKSNKDYIFLSTADPNYPYKEETILTTTKSTEYNTLIVVFSKQMFHVPLSDKGEYVPFVKNDGFQKWLHDLKVHDKITQVEQQTLTIKK